MNKKGKKKGSTFVIVMVLMSIIFLVGASILAVAASDYKIRINESKKIQNLYLADSGLDIVENIILKSTQQIIKYADSEVRKEILNLSNKNSNDKNIIDSNLENIELDSDYVNNRFKEIFIDFINKDKNGIPLFQYLILNKEYIIDIDDKNITSIRYDYNSNEYKQFEITIPEGDEGYRKIEEVVDGEKRIKAIEIKVLSTFEDTNSELKNKKIISTKFKIKVPEYNTKVSVVDMLNIYDKKAITIDGNLELKEGGNLTIDGDIWVKGDSQLNKDSNFVFEKYKGGVVIENSNLKLTGNMYTGESLILRNSTDSKIEGSLYGKNLYLGKTIDGEYSSNNNVTITRDVILNNDLALNDKNSNININGDFYGINDITDNSQIEISSENSEINRNVIRAINSSSIIVNECENSKINIDGAAYIMGVAYLDANDSDGNKYETGESVAIKGNYLAYNDVGEVDENTRLKYYGPLQLLEYDKLSDKANYIFNYYSGNNKNESYNFINGKDGEPIITIEKYDESLSVGASVDKEGNMVYKSLIDIPDNVKDKRKDFILNVLAMGDSSKTNNVNYYDEVKNIVANQIKDAELEKLNLETADKEDTSKEIVIIAKKGDVTLTGNKDDLEIVNKEGLVIVDGNVTIEGALKFSGTIIATGDIIFKDSKDKIIEYDANVIKDILAENKELQNIFKVNNSTSSEIRVSSNSEIYNKESFLETSSWKIEK